MLRRATRQLHRRTPTPSAAAAASPRASSRRRSPRISRRRRRRASSIPSKLAVNFVLPLRLGVVPQGGGHGHSTGNNRTAWFSSWTCGNHCRTKPGVLSVNEGNNVTKYFVSSGFAFVHVNSYADIIAVEAVPLDRIDASLVQKGLSEFTQKLSSASTDLEKAEAQIGLDVHSALNSALTS